MRDYGRIRSRFWCDEEIAALDRGPKLLACYLMSSAHGNAIGCFRLPVLYIAEDLRLTPQEIALDLGALQDIGFILRDPATGWTLLPNHIKHNPIENPNVGRACEKLVAQVPDSFLHLSDLLVALEAAPKHLPETVCELLRKRIATASEQSRNIKPNPKPNPEPKPLADANASSAASAPPDAPPNPKTIVFGRWLDWLAEHEGKPREKIRSLLGQWCRDWGDAAVIEAFQTCARDPPAGDYIEFLIGILQSRGPNGRTAKTSAEHTSVDVNGIGARVARSSGKSVGLGPAPDGELVLPAVQSG